MAVVADAVKVEEEVARAIAAEAAVEHENRERAPPSEVTGGRSPRCMEPRISPLAPPTSMKRAARDRQRRNFLPRPKWRPVRSFGSSAFPSVQELNDEEAFSNFVPLLPAPLLDVPKVPGRRGHRIRQRWKRIRNTALAANELLREFNLLDSGLHQEQAHRRTRAADTARSTLSRATIQLQQHAWKLAAIAASVRRGLSSTWTGAQTTASLIKADLVDRYTLKSTSHVQILLAADALDEPAPGWPTVCMLEALCAS